MSRIERIVDGILIILSQEFEKKQRAIPLLREEVQKLKNRIENSVSGHEKAKQQLAEVLPEYGRLKERLYEVTRQHGEAKRSVNVSNYEVILNILLCFREREELEKQSKNLATDLAEKIREMEIAFNEIKYKKTIEITEMSEKLEREYDSRSERQR